MKYLSFLLVGAIVITGCGEIEAAPTSTNANATATPESAQPAAETSTAIALNTESQVRNDRAIKILSSETVETLGGNQFISPVEGKGGKLFVVYLELKNTGNESGNMMFTQFQLVDSQGRKYDEIQDFEEIVTINTWLEEKGLGTSSDQIFPGGSSQTAKVFRLAPDAEGMKLSVNNTLFDVQ